MEELIPWLIRVETLAERFYRESSELLKDHGKLHQFLLHMADEEKEHQTLLRRAFKVVAGHIPPYHSEITADHHFRERIENFFDQKVASVREGAITRSVVLRTILESEFSEWNDLFVYVMTRLKEAGKEFQKAASEMEKHRKSCIAFMEPYPEYAAQVARLKEMPELWKNRILVIDYSESIRGLLEMVFRYDGQVFSTDNGTEALTLLDAAYFDFIISEIELHGISGIDFFRKASARDPELRKRILFFVSPDSVEDLSSLTELGVPVMEKPGNLTRLMQIVRDALSCQSEQTASAANS